MGGAGVLNIGIEEGKRGQGHKRAVVAAEGEGGGKKKGVVEEQKCDFDILPNLLISVGQVTQTHCHHSLLLSSLFLSLLPCLFHGEHTLWLRMVVGEHRRGGIKNMQIQQRFFSSKHFPVMDNGSPISLSNQGSTVLCLG